MPQAALGYGREEGKSSALAAISNALPSSVKVGGGQ